MIFVTRRVLCLLNSGWSLLINDMFASRDPTIIFVDRSSVETMYHRSILCWSRDIPHIHLLTTAVFSTSWATRLLASKAEMGTGRSPMCTKQWKCSFVLHFLADFRSEPTLIDYLNTWVPAWVQIGPFDGVWVGTRIHQALYCQCCSCPEA